MSWPNLLVAGVAVLFALFLIARILPTAGSDRPRRDLPGMKDALMRAKELHEPRAKAEALLAIGDLLAKDGSPTAATAYYLRALRLDPASVAPLERLATALEHRPRALDRVLWKRLSVLPWEGATRPVAARAAELLSKRLLRRRAEREVLQKLAATLRA